MNRQSLKITVFYCINALGEERITSHPDNTMEIQWVKMACSSMVKDIFLLRAFESGSDGVIVLACPEEACRYGQGSIRAKKRVEWVKAILEEIGLSKNRLSLFHSVAADEGTIDRAIADVGPILLKLGPNPAAGADI
ncbi:MAG: hydrogenase iron-sulfur subunit [Desulfobacterales bacterium]